VEAETSAACFQNKAQELERSPLAFSPWRSGRATLRPGPAPVGEALSRVSPRPALLALATVLALPPTEVPEGNTRVECLERLTRITSPPLRDRESWE
jgi:hypothetical protein